MTIDPKIFILNLNKYSVTMAAVAELNFENVSSLKKGLRSKS